MYAINPRNTRNETMYIINTTVIGQSELVIVLCYLVFGWRPHVG